MDKTEIEIKTKPLEIYEPPKVYNKYNIIYWNEQYKRLEGTEGHAIQTKARIFIEKECIDIDYSDSCFICKPIEGYNKTTHKLKFNGEDFNCSCQFFNKTGKQCSHLTALYLQLQIWKSENKQINWDELISKWNL